MNKIQSLSPENQELVTLLQDLIKIPSWVPDGPDDEKLKSEQNENQLVDYLENWLKTNTDLEVKRHLLDYGRFNLIASKGSPDLLFLAHTDTVAPSQDAPYDQLAGEIHDDQIWGRGATDMKSGIATMLQAIKLTKNLNNFMFALYADEEYDFLGMKAFAKEYSNIRPKLIVSSDGSDLSIGHGCRGLIELRARVTGKSGHAAKQNGKNAITATFNAVENLKSYLQEFNHPVMGTSSINLAYCFGGAKLADSFADNLLTKVGQAGNVIPDINEFVLDIRPASPDLTIDKVIENLSAYFTQNGYGFEVITKRHNLGAWFTDIKEIEPFVALAQEITPDSKINNPGDTGYIDLQMIWEVIGRPSALMYGGGIGSTAHSPEERIRITDLVKTRDFFLKVLEKYGAR